MEGKLNFQTTSGIQSQSQKDRNSKVVPKSSSKETTISRIKSSRNMFFLKAAGSVAIVKITIFLDGLNAIDATKINLGKMLKGSHFTS